MTGVVALAAAALLVSGGAAQTGSRIWRPDDRVVLSDYGVIDAVAVSRDYVYGATRAGLIAYDRRARRWRPPVTRLDDWPAERVLALAVDPSDDSVWLGSAGGLHHYRPRLREIEHTMVPGPVTRILFDRRDPFRGVFVESAGRWLLYPRAGIATETMPGERDSRIGGEALREVLAAFPAAEAAGAFVLRDDQMITYRFTAAARDRTRGVAYFGTNGMGIVRYDPVTADAELLPYGLHGSVTTAVRADGGRVWVATLDRRGPVVTLLGSDAQYFEHFRGPRVGGYPFARVASFANWKGERWVVTERGLVAVESGVPAAGDIPRDVRAVTSDGDVTWLGSPRGVVRLNDDRIAGFAPIGAVHAVAVGDEALWVGVGERIVRLHRVDLAPLVEGGDIALDGSVVALDAARDRVAGVSAREVGLRSQGEWRVMPGPTDILPLVAVSLGDESAWIGGRDGVAYVDLSTGALRTVVRRVDLPGAVTALDVAAGFVWVATEGGLVRFDERALLQ